MEENSKHNFLGVNGPEEADTLTNRTSEVLIDSETSFDDLLIILRKMPGLEEAEKVEKEEQRREAREAELKEKLGEDYEAAMEDTIKPLSKVERRPGAIRLRTEVPRIAEKKMGNDGLCEAFNNGYGIYDNGDRKTVVWIPDCGSVTYHFAKLRDNEKQYQVEKSTVGEDVLGPLPWYIAVLIRGENTIERNLDHPKSQGTMSDSDDPEEYELPSDPRWIGSTRFASPEDAYIRKEEIEEHLSEVNGRIQEVCDLLSQNFNHREIGEILGLDRATVSTYVRRAREKMKKEKKKKKTKKCQPKCP